MIETNTKCANCGNILVLGETVLHHTIVLDLYGQKQKPSFCNPCYETVRELLAPNMTYYTPIDIEGEVRRKLEERRTKFVEAK